MNKKNCLAYIFLSCCGFALVVWSMSYFFWGAVEPWRNFRWQLVGVIGIISGFTSMSKILPEGFWDQEPKKPLFIRFEPVQSRLFIIVGIVIFVLSWF